MIKWRFQNISRRTRKVTIRSVEHAIELFMDASGETEFGVCLEFTGSPNGVIHSIAGSDFASLAYDPNLEVDSISLDGFQRAIPNTPLAEEWYYFDDGSCLSSLRADDVLPVLDAVEGLRFILTYNDYPSFLRWERGC